MCIPVHEDRCFVRPCPAQGECWSDHDQSRCHPDSDCANVTFTFTKDIMPEVRAVEKNNIRRTDVSERASETFRNTRRRNGRATF